MEERRIGCTGHIDLARIAGLKERDVIAQIGERLLRWKKAVLYCGLADGSDMLFAEAALAAGAELVAVLPCSPEEFAGEHRDPAAFFGMAGRAREVVTVRHASRYVGVMEYLAANCDELFALWDGVPLPLFDGAGAPVNRGGAYDTVLAFRRLNKPVTLFPLPSVSRR